MRLRRVVLVALWVPVAALLGPVLMLHHGLTQFAGGAVGITLPFAVGWLWHHLAPRWRQAAWATGGVLGLGLLLTSWGQADAYYLRHNARPRQVVVARVDCVRAKHGCTDQVALADPDGRPLPLLMYDLAGRRTAGERLTVRWDRLGYAQPTPLTWSGTTEPYDPTPALAPAWLWAGLLVLHLAAVGGAAGRALTRTRSRRRTAS